MNITDIDDKIIRRARHNFLVQQYTDGQKVKANLVQVKKDLTEAFEQWIVGQGEVVKALEVKVAAGDEDSAEELGEERFKLNGVLEEQKAFVAAAANKTADVFELIAIGRGVLGEALDKKKGATVTDHSIFQAHAYRYEQEFHEDMRALGILVSSAFAFVMDSFYDPCHADLQ